MNMLKMAILPLIASSLITWVFQKATHDARNLDSFFILEDCHDWTQSSLEKSELMLYFTTQ